MAEKIELTFHLKSNFWEEEREFKLDTSIAEIDLEDLENELVTVSDDYAHVFFLYECARANLEQTEISIEFITSNTYTTFKNNHEKITETHLKHMLLADATLNNFKKGIAELKHTERLLYVLVKSIDKKSNELRSLSARRNAEVQSTI